MSDQQIASYIAENKKTEQPAPGSPSSGAEPSGYVGANPSTAGPNSSGGGSPHPVESATPENKEKRINPSPEDANVSPDTSGDNNTTANPRTIDPSAHRRKGL